MNGDGEQKIMHEDHSMKKGDERIFVQQESWTRRNAIPLLTSLGSVIVMLFVLGGWFGKVTTTMANYETQLAGYRVELTKVEAYQAELNIKVDSHHTDSSKHLDVQKWELMQNQIRSIMSMSERNYKAIQSR